MDGLESAARTHPCLTFWTCGSMDPHGPPPMSVRVCVYSHTRMHAHVNTHTSNRITHTSVPKGGPGSGVHVCICWRAGRRQQSASRHVLSANCAPCAASGRPALSALRPTPNAACCTLQNGAPLAASCELAACCHLQPPVANTLPRTAACWLPSAAGVPPLLCSLLPPSPLCPASLMGPSLQLTAAPTSQLLLRNPCHPLAPATQLVLSISCCLSFLMTSP